MVYLSPEDILVIHARIIDETGGAHGVRSVGTIASAAERPRMKFGGKELYKSVFDKAAAYFESIAFFHPFTDGNKRTAIALAARFIFLNGFILKTSNGKLEKFVLDAVIRKYDIKTVSRWLKKNSEKMKRK